MLNGTVLQIMSSTEGLRHTSRLSTWEAKACIRMQIHQDTSVFGTGPKTARKPPAVKTRCRRELGLWIHVLHRLGTSRRDYNFRTWDSRALAKRTGRKRTDVRVPGIVVSYLACRVRSSEGQVRRRCNVVDKPVGTEHALCRR